jgi:hypothetical protein
MDGVTQSDEWGSVDDGYLIHRPVLVESNSYPGEGIQALTRYLRAVTLGISSWV